MNDDCEKMIDVWAEDNLDANSCERLDAWLSEHPEHGVEFVRQMMLHRLLADLSTAAQTQGVVVTAAPRSRFRARHIALALGVATCLIVGSVLFWSGMTTPTANAPHSKIATLTWTDSSVSGDEQIFVGQAIGSQAIRTGDGHSDFLLCSGTTIAVYGESELTLDGPMQAKLARGSARFACPPAAKGFTVILPNGDRVIDLGTAFEVSVDPSGPIEVAVTEGSVQYISHLDEEKTIHVDHRLRLDGNRLLREGPPPDSRDQEIAIVNAFFDRPVADFPPDDHEKRRQATLPVGWTQLPVWRKARLATAQGTFSPHTPPYAAQFTGDPVGGTGVYQSVATVPGVEYELRYHVTRKGGGVVALIAADVFDGKDAEGDEGDIASERTRIGWRAGEWREQTMRFTARSETTTIRFSEPEDSESHGVAPAIDTVRLFSIKPKAEVRHVTNVTARCEFCPTIAEEI